MLTECRGQRHLKCFAGSVALSPKRTSLHAVAAAAGVSLMTVSRALRNAREISPATRQRVLRAAERIGYRPNPHLARLMFMVRGAKRRNVRAVIGVVRDDIPQDELHDPAFQYVSTADIRIRAEQHGYAVEEFFMGRDGISPERLRGILLARGIEGIIVSPQSSRHLAGELDFSPFAAATFGYGLQSPALHRASANMMQGILETTERLARRGYTRIGLAVTRWIDNRSSHTYSGGLLHYQQQVDPKDRVPPLFLPDNLARCATVFCDWFQQFRPDVVISLNTYVPDWVTKRMRLHIPEEVGFVVHDWTEEMAGFAGIFHRRPDAAAAAVDLVATQLMHNEHGIPTVPRQVLIPPLWIDGPSVRTPA